jgi:hypothetical protein
MSMFWLRHTFHASIPYIRIWRCFEFAIACASLCGRFTSDKAAYVNFMVSFVRMTPSADVRVCSTRAFFAPVGARPLSCQTYSS